MEDKALFLNLLPEITTNIFSRLPIKTITICKCVCRKWLDLLSSPKFADFHLSTSSTPGLVVYQLGTDKHSCKVVEFQDELPEFHHHDLHYNPVLEFDTKTFISPSNAKLMQGSVNGFLCLHHTNADSFDALYICNPIRREYIALPLLKGKLEYPNVSTYGFGMSSSSGLYKVVRVNHGPIENGPMIKIPDFVCHVYTLGTTGTWKSIELGLGPDRGPCHYTCSFNSVFLNGDETDQQLVSCFDLETELFSRFSLPPLRESFLFPVTLSVLWDCLCFCESGDDERIFIWVMKDYGVENLGQKNL